MQQQTQARDLSHRDVQQACRSALLEVLETMFFELPVEEIEEVPAPAEGSCLVKAGFHGSLDGMLQLALSCPTCVRLAAAFLGTDEAEIGEAERCNTAKELANMLCGASLSRLRPSGRLSIETPSAISEPEPDSGPWLRFPLEGGFIDVALRYGETI